MSHTSRPADADFLIEYVQFTSNGPLSVAEALLHSTIHAHEIEAFEKAAHYQVYLHATLIQLLETTGALLRAYSKWDQPGGILHSLFTYRPGDILAFMKKLKASHDTIGLLCFPSPDKLQGFDSFSDFTVRDCYSHEHVKETIDDLCNAYLNDEWRSAYNKVKHAGLYVRHPEMLHPELGNIVENDRVFIMRDQKTPGTPIDYSQLEVTGQGGLDSTKKYYKNIEAVARRSRAIANFVAVCLQRDLMTKTAQD